MMINIELDNVRFFHNSANAGGAIYNDLEGIIQGRYLNFDKNTSTSSGGAINNNSGEISLQMTEFSRNEAGYGGAIYNNDEFTLVDSTIISNTVTDYGGGIDNTVGSSITLHRVTVNGNQAYIGGGISNFGPMQIKNSTISSNSADANGGESMNLGSTEVYNTTITANMAADREDTGNGGGVYAENASQFSFRNSILYGNQHLRIGTPYPDDCYGILTTQQYNLIGTLTNCTLDNDQGSDLVGVNPMLAPLAENGGPTQTHALMFGSPAIDTGNPSGCMDRLGILLFTDSAVSCAIRMVMVMK